jgi:hypothetical protein
MFVAHEPTCRNEPLKKYQVPRHVDVFENLTAKKYRH